jgi:hypothetical protein
MVALPAENDHSAAAKLQQARSKRDRIAVVEVGVKVDDISGSSR